MITCNICPKTMCKKELRQHLTLAHGTRLISLIYTCRYEACGRSYSNYKTLHKHQRQYKHFERVSTYTESVQLSNANTQYSEPSISNDWTSDCDDTVVFEESNVECTENELRMVTLATISSLQSDATLTRTQIDRITRILYSFYNTKYFNDLKQHISAIESPNSNNIIERFETFQRVFKELDNEYKRNKILTELKYYIEPTRIFFGNIDTRNKDALKTVDVYGQLISLKEVFKVFFEIDDTFDKTCKYITSLNEDSNNGITNIVQTTF